MRSAFIQELVRLAREDNRIYLVVGDLGYSVTEPFAEAFPDRFLNAGVAEQNMMGLAAGLALAGKVVFTYSITNFCTLRCLEQIRNDVCYHHANVKIVSVGSGLVYGSLGTTHHGTEDLAVMRALPEMTVVAPGDPLEATLATRAVAAQDGPCYLRLGKAGDAAVHAAEPEFTLGRAIEVGTGGDITLIATGNVLPNALKAAELLGQGGVSARLLSMHTLKPLDNAIVIKAARETGHIVTIEEHGITGGLGSAVAEVLAEAGLGIPFKRLGTDGRFCTAAGSQKYLQGVYGLSAEAVARAACGLIKGGCHGI